MDEQRLAGTVAVITGGASGIGAGTAHRFVAEGASVLIADLNAEAGQALADELGDRAAFLQTNVAVEADMAATVAEALDLFGRLDTYVNNAGFGGALGPIASTSVDDFDLTFDVLVKSVFLGIKHAAPVLCEQGSGSIINTASVAGLSAGFAPHLYTAAKTAVIALTETVALELAESNVRCNAVAPGMIITPLAFGRPDATAEQLAALRQASAGGQPMPRPGEPRDIAAMIAFLASADAEWITGQTMVVDGGISVGPKWENLPEPFRTHRPIRHHRPPGR
ncbi:MAG: glucose 1-dehydrogenase [Acidimicrobiales bacterium]